MHEGNKATSLHNVGFFFPPQVCDDLLFVKIILTNLYFMILTTNGLFGIEDLCRPTRKIIKVSHMKELLNSVFQNFG